MKKIKDELKQIEIDLYNTIRIGKIHQYELSDIYMRIKKINKELNKNNL